MLQQLEKECKQYLHQPERYAFKKVGAKTIVVLQKTPNFISNEMRKGIFDKFHAKFRANEFLVVDIINMKTLKHNQYVDNLFDVVVYNRSPSQKDEVIKFRYEVGYIVKPDMYDNNIQNICTHGIHYYLSLDAAFYHNRQHKDGKCILYHKNGAKQYICSYQNGDLHGEYLEYDENGRFLNRYEFVYGMRDVKAESKKRLYLY